MLSDNHDLCVLNAVNARVKSKSVMKITKRKVWKPTRKVFTNIRYTWRPTGQTFTIVGNACPLTRITTTAKVPLRKPTALESDTPKPVESTFSNVLSSSLDECRLPKLFSALKDDLRKLKGKALVDDDVTSHSIAPEMLQVHMEPLAPKLLNNRTAHYDYLRHTQEQAAILREVVEQGKSQNPLNNSLNHA
nr:hypothetical protein [Tanacetum cinerariifolium]